MSIKEKNSFLPRNLLHLKEEKYPRISQSQRIMMSTSVFIMLSNFLSRTSRTKNIYFGTKGKTSSLSVNTMRSLETFIQKESETLRQFPLQDSLPFRTCKYGPKLFMKQETAAERDISHPIQIRYKTSSQKLQGTQLKSPQLINQK